MRFDKLKRLVDPARPITYGIVQAGPEFEGGVPYIRPADMTDESGVKDFGSIKHTSPEIALQYRRSAVRNGDLVISIGPSFGKVMEVPAELDGANLTQGTARVAPGPNLHARFAFWCLRSHHCYSQWEAGIGGATFRALNLGPLSETRIPKPDLATQRQIADFLDRETARIDLLIEKKQRLVALLGEKLDRTVRACLSGETDYPNKHQHCATGIGYLPTAPKHWSVEKVGWRYEIQLGKMLDSAKQTGEHRRRYLRVADVHWNKINTDDLPEMDFSPGDRKRFRLQPGDLLVNEGGSYVGRSAVWYSDDAEVYYQKALHRVRPRNPKRDSAEFLYYLMWFATKYGVFVAGGNQTTIDHLTAEAFGRYRFAFPTLDEQIAISGRLKKEEAKQDAVSTKINASIDRLKEYRSALITAAVTGQIDVTTTTKSGTPDRRLDVIQEEMGA